jgi:hypothetical protein
MSRRALGSSSLPGSSSAASRKLSHTGSLLVGLIDWSGCVGTRFACGVQFSIQSFAGADLLITQAVAVGAMSHLVI